MAPPHTPIDQVIEILATEFSVPDRAIAAAVRRIDEAAPALLEVLERAANRGLRLERDRVLLFRALPVLAATRQQAACRPLLRLLRRPEAEVDATLGDLVTETLPRIVASVFDGDAEALFQACGDRRISEAARWSLLLAVAFLAWNGRIGAAAAHAFLRRFHGARLAGRLDAAWLGWAEAVALLGLSDLAPAAEGVLAEFPPHLDSRPRFREALADALAAPGDVERLRSANTGTVDDALEAFDWLRQADDGDDVYGDPGAGPAVNPLRGVGRNDPCPCGSGRKYKKCCLPAA